MPTRSPIVSILGHVDHGKSSILDKIRGGAIVDTEAGGITQAIGASIIPLDTVKKICGPLINPQTKFSIPGLLFIDTPGHAAFTNLRKRGGNLADIAIVVIDINEGFMPQTIETIEILKQYKTPFIVAANKIDLCEGWRKENTNLVAKFKDYGLDIQKLDEKLYNVVAQFSEHGFNAERFDRVDDYTKQIAIVPVCAKTAEGIPELLMVLIGLAQKFLEENLKTTDGPAKGTVLEVKEEKGLGKTLDVILYDGMLKTNDIIVIGTMGEPIVTKVRALLQPEELSEMRDKKAKFKPLKEVHAATGIKISAPELDAVVSGMPIRGATKETLEQVKADIKNEVEEVVIETDDEGIIIKADTLGSLEAMINLFKGKDIKIRAASVGNISKKDIADAMSNYDKDPLKATILAFNADIAPEAQMHITPKVKIIKSNIIYRLLDEYEVWKAEATKILESKDMEGMIRPCKIQLLKNYIFRQSNPAIVGGEVLAGTAKTTMPLMNAQGKEVTYIKAMQKEKESVNKVEKGTQVALSLADVTIGRQLKGDEVLYSAINEFSFRKLKDMKQFLTPDETETIKEIADIMRKENPMWGI